MRSIFSRSKTPPSDRTIKTPKQKESRGQRKWFDAVTASARCVRVVSVREVEYRIAELDALDEQDYF